MKTTTLGMLFVVVLGQFPFGVLARSDEFGPESQPPSVRPKALQQQGSEAKLTTEAFNKRLLDLTVEATRLLEAGEFASLHSIRQQQIDLHVATYGETHWNVRGMATWQESGDRMAAASPAEQQLLKDAFQSMTAGQRLIQQGLLRPGIARLSKSGEIFDRVLGADDRLTIEVNYNLSQAELRDNDYEAAYRHGLQMAEPMRRAFGEKHLSYGIALNILGLIERKAGKVRESESHLSQSIEILQPYLDDPTASSTVVKPYVTSLVLLSKVMNDDERFVEAEVHATNAMVTAIEKMPAERTLVLLGKVELARSKSAREKLDEATKLFKEVCTFMESFPKSPPPPEFSHPIYVAYAKHLRKAGLTDELPAVEDKVQKLAEELARQAATVAREKGGTINR